MTQIGIIRRRKSCINKQIYYYKYIYYGVCDTTQYRILRNNVV